MLSQLNFWKSVRFSLATAFITFLAAVSHSKETTVFKKIEQSFDSGKQVEGSLNMRKCTLIKPRKSARTSDPRSFAFMLNPAQISRTDSKDGNLLKTTFNIRQQDFLITPMGVPPGIYLREVNVTADGTNNVRIKESEWQGLWECPDEAFKFD